MRLKFGIILAILLGTSENVWEADAGVISSYSDGVSLRAVADSNNLFMAKIYDVLKETYDRNLIFSPFALSTQLGMLKQGAGGNTSDEIQTASLFAYDDPTIFRGYFDLIKLYKLTPATKSTTNQIFLGGKFSTNYVFQRTIETYFDGNFKRVLNLTKSSIEEISKNISQNKYKGLVSAVFLESKLSFNYASTFQSLWESRFDPKKTVMESFFKNDDDFVKVPMMKITTELELVDLPHLGAKAISLPFQNNQLNLIILLPNTRTGLWMVEKQLKEYSFYLISDRILKADMQNVSLTLPKFDIKSAIDLQEPLEQLGMKSLFSPDEANLTRINLLRGPVTKGSIPLHVTGFVQSTQLYFNEEGSFGSQVQPSDSASQEDLSYELGDPPTNIVEFNVNRPFMGYIHDWITDTVLYTFRKVE
ncbi:unnamed protein product [Allacma fusca]|uniref:Serpin domain-containing protein n=1 Tax=Allacma fusca TaxID=39272 RepID=A0A8J2L232_9HEXA|nr:unnamed protein product [Allacma fusca]